MKWINLLNNCKIPYYIYKLHKNDSTIICSKYNSKNTLTIVLHGSIYIIKIFSNKKIIPTVILNKDSIFNIANVSNQFYYQLIALEKTYILTIKVQNLQKLNNQLMIHLIESYKNTLNSYQIMNETTNQKFRKNQVLQTILYLFFEFGIVNKKQIQLPFKISLKNLANITGMNQETISKIIKEINNKSNISYCKKKSIHINNIFNLTKR
uniref:Global nitrogen transcriptional regulator n=1 Tax=Laurenciella marilzae TaxID=1413812 RepID=A0A1Z1M1W3_9FLOR|nr:global nitrogen transcriptional regulator [Laurenciella marilzae]ARW59880.1 global nitrogen transcriptional regulator [Laurenciella marilzae]